MCHLHYKMRAKPLIHVGDPITGRCCVCVSAQNMYKNLGRKGPIRDAKRIVNKIVRVLEKVSL